MNKFVIPDQQDFIYEIFSDGFIEELQPLMKRVTTTPRDFGNKVRLTITYLVDHIPFSYYKEYPVEVPVEAMKEDFINHVKHQAERHILNTLRQSG